MQTFIPLITAFVLTISAVYMVPRPAEAPTPDFEIPAEQAPHIARAAELGITPVRIAVPSLGLDVPIIDVGLNAKGQMDVPDGRTLAVGWYSAGTKPGAVGSAVLAAHVYAAFKRLRNIKPGAEIIVYGSNGEVRTFVAAEKKTYALADVPAETLFHRQDGAWINLITCAGAWSRALNTYEKRLIVYAQLKE